MHDLFVYGTLKKGGSNHEFIEGSKFLRHEILNDHAIYKPNGFNFPIMIPNEDSKVYGEVYRVDSDTLYRLDMLEQEGTFYNRLDNSILGYQYYLWKDRRDLFFNKKDKIKNGYWATKGEVDLNLIIDNRKYTDKADKLVFHMRFFDGKRAPTNKIYMDLVKRRSYLDLNIENEEIFLRDCIIEGVVSEWKEPSHSFNVLQHLR
tara:strand:+ start:627 stop:1238 length:612 start_codon:yes stop_codon:yes gene_type:complete